MSGAKPSKDGIGKVIPASRRADGSIRKEVRVREGFIAAEDQVGFVSQRVMHNANYIPGTTRTRNISQIGSIPGINRAASSDPNADSDLTPAQRKNKARNEKKKAAKLNGTATADPTPKSTSPAPSAVSSLKTAAVEVDDATSIEKKIKGIQKKLRQIDTLKSLDPASLDQDQALKVKGEVDLKKQVDDLTKQLSLL